MSKKRYDFYLAGAVAHDQNAMEWRKQVEIALPQFRFYNPLEHEEKVAGATLRDSLAFHRQQADAGNRKALEDHRHLMYEHVIPNDIQGLGISNGLIAYIKRDQRICGTFIEMYEMFLLQGKPVFLVSELSYAEMTNWEIALSSIIFKSVDELIGYFQKEENVNKAMRRRDISE